MNSAVVWSMVSSLVYFQLCSTAPVTLSKAGEESLKFSKFFEAKKANGQDLSLLTDVGISLECETCKLFSGVLADFLEKDGPEEDVAKLVKVFCILLKIEDENVCNSVVEEFKQWVLTVAYSITLGRASNYVPSFLALLARPGITLQTSHYGKSLCLVTSLQLSQFRIQRYSVKSNAG